MSCWHHSAVRGVEQCLLGARCLNPTDHFPTEVLARAYFAPTPDSVSTSLTSNTQGESNEGINAA